MPLMEPFEFQHKTVTFYIRPEITHDDFHGSIVLGECYYVDNKTHDRSLRYRWVIPIETDTFIAQEVLESLTMDTICERYDAEIMENFKGRLHKVPI